MSTMGTTRKARKPKKRRKRDDLLADMDTPVDRFGTSVKCTAPAGTRRPSSEEHRDNAGGADVARTLNDNEAQPVEPWAKVLGIDLR
jgi:hypothetical protein